MELEVAASKARRAARKTAKAAPQETGWFVGTVVPESVVALAVTVHVSRYRDSSFNSLALPVWL